MEDIHRRLKSVEDYISIQQLISSYGPAADSSSMDLLRDIWTEDSVYDVRGLVHLKGEQVFGAFCDDDHLGAIANGCAHVATMPHIVVSGDEASATLYMAIYRYGEAGYSVRRLVASRLLLKRTESGWRVYRRTNIPLNGDQEAPRLLSRAQSPPTPEEMNEAASPV